MNSKHPAENSKQSLEEPGDHVPWLRSWPRLYALVLGELAILVVLFYLFTKAFE
jgi:hypothetical protein